MRSVVVASAVAILAACTNPPVNPSPDVAAAAAPTGTLRAAINVGNPVLAHQDATTGEAGGVSVDLARELARRLGVPLTLVIVPTAAQSVETIKAGTCDVAFVAIDPARAADLEYTAAYVQIEGVYLVAETSPIRSNAQVDRPGVRVVVGAASAYDLFLARELREAQLVRVPTSAAVVETMLAQHLDVAAGVKQQLQADAKRVAGVRLLDGRFMVIQQALATAKGRGPAVAYFAAFIEEMKASGFVARALAENGIEGASVAPARGP